MAWRWSGDKPTSEPILDRVLSIGILRTNLSENFSEIHICFIKENAFEIVVYNMTAFFSSVLMCQPGSTTQCARTEPEPVRRWERLAGPGSIPAPAGRTGKHLCKHIFYTHSSQTPHISLLRGEAWGVCCEKLGEHSSPHHGTKQHMHIQNM